MIKKNDQFELDITSMTHDGLGVGHNDGMAVFVQGAVDGEKVKAKVIKVAKSYAVARMEEIIDKSPDRVEPFCPAYKRCGGCSLQHMSYEKTLAFKRQVVIDNLTRIGGLTGIEVKPTIGMQDPLRYRNKAQYPVGIGKTGPVAGFFARHSHEIIDSKTCDIQHPANDLARDAVMEFIRAYRISIYNEESNRGLIRHVVTRVGFHTGEVMVIIVSASPSIPKIDRLVDILKGRIQNLKSIILNINDKRGNVIVGEKNITLYGKDFILDKLGDLTFEISPLSFYQTNSIQTEILYDKAIEYANLKGNETVFDLYCGIGTITLFAAQKAKRVIGVEVVAEAVESAKRNAERNGINNTEFYCGEVEKAVPELNEQGIKADVVFIDPPRKGCDEALLNTLVEVSPKQIIYVSCNPSTLARDLKYLCAYGYEVKDVQPVDMFPWTEHVECVVRIQRAN